MFTKELKTIDDFSNEICDYFNYELSNKFELESKLKLLKNLCNLAYYLESERLYYFKSKGHLQVINLLNSCLKSEIYYLNRRLQTTTDIKKRMCIYQRISSTHKKWNTEKNSYHEELKNVNLYKNNLRPYELLLNKYITEYLKYNPTLDIEQLKLEIIDVKDFLKEPLFKKLKSHRKY